MNDDKQSISSAPDGAGTPEMALNDTAKVSREIEHAVSNLTNDDAEYYGPENARKVLSKMAMEVYRLSSAKLSSLEQQRDALKRENATQTARVKELEGEVDGFKGAAETNAVLVNELQDRLLAANKEVGEAREGAANFKTISEDLAKELVQAYRKQPLNTHRRLFDLVRYQRAELHQLDLITDDEYAMLCQFTFEDDPPEGSPSARRLDDYDELRKQLTALRATLTKPSEASEDGKRLDWLDANVTVAAKYRCQRPASDHDGPTYWSFNWSQWLNNEENSLTIRAAIDAAIAAPSATGGGKL